MGPKEYSQMTLRVSYQVLEAAEAERRMEGVEEWASSLAPSSSV